MKLKVYFTRMAIALSCLSPVLALAAVDVVRPGEGYVARQESLRAFFDALSAPLGKPIVVSQAVARRSISGEFSFSDAQQTLQRITQQMALIWYSDGQTLYMYEAAEAKSKVISLNTITVDKLTSFLRRSGLFDPRYPLRNDGLRTFYVSGPPLYVDLVMQAAQFMDSQGADLQLGQQRIGVIHLRNTFVGDRTYELRDQSIVVPGIATSIEVLLKGEKLDVEVEVSKEGRGAMPDFPLRGLAGPESVDGLNERPRVIARDSLSVSGAGNIRVVAYPDTNSLLVKGLPEQVRFIENLVSALDEPKRHIELSLWIIDLQKNNLNELGVDWKGSFSIGSSISGSLNGGSLSTLDGNSFVAAVSALEETKRAKVVSRPVVLTQENVPAIFDNNRTFYTQLIGERSVSLEQVTYGTLVSVLPRISGSGEIEMDLNIEDGSEVDTPRDRGSNPGANSLPTVGRTRISTVARVPRGKSLLVGGFTRDESGEQIRKIPVLGSIPFLGKLFSYRQKRDSNTVRVFLIQPKELYASLEPGAAQIGARVIGNVGRDSADRAVLRAMEP
ncbi:MULTISPECIES: type III secretion system outer membrane ring subunit SctC [unclassified Pseudomonas]|uniref:type III secretion system outer membrane ring subunit SctC n=1 Tax=unclassified Pseudomonas TaxID=196821 RepID=UPI000BE38AD6|nr:MULTISPECIES: type III secretion system outer membrane ring subunit SctC [unclassified Pseudomonas]